MKKIEVSREVRMTPLPYMVARKQLALVVRDLTRRAVSRMDIPERGTLRVRVEIENTTGSED